MNKIDWNYERYRTRDRLIEYDEAIMPLMPHTAGLPIIYPWENIFDQIDLEKHIYNIAANNGYDGSEEEFWNAFSRENIIFSTVDQFPKIGNERFLYLDTETGILYYFKISDSVNQEFASIVGVAIVDKTILPDSEEEYYLYIPISARAIENLITEVS